MNDVYARERLVLAQRPDSKKPIEAGSRFWQLDNIGYATTFSSGHIGKRVRGKGAVMLAVRKHHTVGCHSWSEDGYHVTQPGDFLITLNTEDGVHSCVGLESTIIVVPADLLEIDWTRFQKTQILRVGTLGNRLLSIAIEDWTKRLTAKDAGAAALLEAEVLSLVKHVLQTAFTYERDSRFVRHTRGEAMRQYVRENAANSSLSIDQICDTFGASRASVFRVFSENGGVRRYANEYRLRRAMFRLSQKAPERGTVGRVATEFGYTDALAFSKVFKRYFGFSPSDAIDLHRLAN